MTIKTWFALGAVTVVIIALGLYAAHDTAPAATAALVTNDNAILLPDQPSNTDTVVPYVKLSQPGFVLVYTTTTTTTTDGKQLLGTSDLLSAGEHRNVHVHHNGGTKPADGSTITATIVADNGDGTYSDTTDTDPLIADDEQPTADISDDAVVDPAPTDEELASELTDAGYDVDESAVTNDSAATDVTPADDPSDTSPIDSASTTEDIGTPDDSATTTDTDATQDDSDTTATSTDSVDASDV